MNNKRYLLVHTPLLLQEISGLRDDIFEFEENLLKEDEQYLHKFFNVGEVAGLRRDISRITEKIKKIKDKPRGAIDTAVE